MWSFFKKRSDPPKAVERQIGRVRDGMVHRGPTLSRDVKPGDEQAAFIAAAARALETEESSLRLDVNLVTSYGVDELQIYECVQDAEDIWRVQLLPWETPVAQFSPLLARFPSLASIITAAQSSIHRRPNEALQKGYRGRIARRPWGLVVLGVAALAGFFYSLSGYAMAGSFTISNSEQLSHWRRVSTVYLACAVMSALTALGAIVILFRRGRRPRRSNLPAA